ncbi:unnamed protein product, partial [Phaeothamnion confervicola]
IVFDGVVFRGNTADGAGGYGTFGGGGQGGAVAAKFAAPLFRSCLFDTNAVGGGSGVPSTGGAVFLFCCHDDKIQGVRGCGGGSGGNPTFEDCVFQANVAGRLPSKVFSSDGARVAGAAAATSYHGMGGALSASSSSPAFIRCTFSGNRAVVEYPTSVRHPTRAGGGGGSL